MSSTDNPAYAEVRFFEADPFATLAYRLQPPVWHAQAACLGVGNHLFFLELGEPSDQATAVCRSCPVRKPCLEYALDSNIKFGVWGGTSERQRRKMRRVRLARQRRRQQQAA